MRLERHEKAILAAGVAGWLFFFAVVALAGGPSSATPACVQEELDALPPAMRAVVDTSDIHRGSVSTYFFVDRRDKSIIRTCLVEHRHALMEIEVNPSNTTKENLQTCVCFRAASATQGMFWAKANTGVMGKYLAQQRQRESAEPESPRDVSQPPGGQGKESTPRKQENTYK